MTDDLVITPDEVRATARVPRRDRVGALAFAALLLTGIVFAARGDPPPVPDPPPLDPTTCGVDPLPPRCVARLPVDQQAHPTVERYVDWRMTALVRPDLASGRVTFLSAPELRPWAELLPDGRHATWRDVAATELALEDAQRAERDRTVRWLELADAVAATLGSLAVGLALAWAALGPRQVAVSLHQLRIGRRVLPWSEVGAVDWGAGRVRIGTRTWSLGPWTLDPAARSALASATDRARTRARAPRSSDPDDLRELGGLRSAVGRPERS